MAPYDFQAPDADVILRSSDGKDFRVHKVILGLASPVFQGMFSLPQPTGPEPHRIPIVAIPETSDLLSPLIQYIYPFSPPNVPDVAMWADLYTIADKYNVGVVMELLRGILIPRFLETSPFRIYALASHWGLDEEAKIASKRTLSFDILEEFSREDAKLMDGPACQKLYRLHIRCREEASAVVESYRYVFEGHLNSGCRPLDPGTVGRVLTQRVSVKPWFSAEELYEEITQSCNLCECPSGCCQDFGNLHTWFSSILEELHELEESIVQEVRLYILSSKFTGRYLNIL